jgi:tight adherence protein C
MERLWLLVAFASFAYFAYNFLGPSPQERTIIRRAIAIRPAKMDALAVEDEEMSLPFSQRVLAPLTNALRGQALRYTPVGLRRRTEDKLLRAGRPMEVGTLFAIRFLGFGIAVVFGLLLSMMVPSIDPGKKLLVVFGAAAVGLILPETWLNGKVAKRRADIQSALPDVLDLLCISVEAGLGFDAAIQKVAEKFKGPIGEEFQEYIKEVKLGRSRVEALRGLSRRTDLDDLRSFVASLVQAEQLGISLANILRLQSEQMRYRRRQRAQEQAMKVPIKMLFPLAFFILPTIFIVLFAPVGIHLMEVLKGV